ncbi:MAG: DEAD/DEAH box helicase [Myxococcales bacterium]|nr:DEAD/DEAH box helicase [Myxococcales bacterium]
MKAFMDCVREACSRPVWSRGVELTRADAVHGISEHDSDITLQVTKRGGLVTHTQILYLDDLEWECDCRSSDDPCEHVAAACIALHRARKSGARLPTTREPMGTLRYRLRRGTPSLSIEREIVHSRGIHLLETTLDALASGRIPGPKFVATQADLAVERALGTRRRGVVPPGLLPALFSALEDCPDITLDGRAVEVSSDPLVPHCRLVNAPGGFRLILSVGTDVTEMLGDGVALCGETLRLRGNTHLSGREIHELVRGRFFSHAQVAELVTEVLPELRERIPVDVEADTLPDTSTTELPRISIQVERRGDTLSVLPLLVYGNPAIARVDGEHLVHIRGRIPMRDKRAESLRIQHLRDALGLSPGYRVDFRQGQALEFAARLARWKGEIEGDDHLAFYLTEDLEPDLEVAGDRIRIAFHSPSPAGTSDPARAEIADGEQRVAATSDVLRAWQQGDSLVPLHGGGFAALPEDWLERYGDRIADLLAAQPEDGPLPTSAMPDLFRLCEDLDHPPPASFERLRPLLEDFDGIPRATLPGDFNGTLRGYQVRGVDWLILLRELELGALLADDMGLGKTVQALCAIQGPTLIVCPTSVLFNWAEEMQRFRPGLSFSLYHGAGRELDGKAEVTLTSYAILRLDIDILSERSWQTVVLDEAQNIKNSDSQVARAAYRLNAKFRVALTGTPVENRLEELWSQFHFLNPGLLGGRTHFRNRYARPIAEGDPNSAALLRERIRPFLMRRKKQEVAPELPRLTELVLHCELSDEERAVYDAVRAATVEQVVAQLSEGGNVLAALEALLRLRQAACHVSLVPGQQATGSSKLELLLTRLEQAMADGHKALVFSQWTSLLDLVEPQLNQGEIPFVRLDGSTRDRGSVVKQFQSEDGPPVMLVSLKAGGTGLNLTAADHVFLLDPWWNPAVEDQAAARSHRIGQTRPVVVHRLVARDTVEEGILELHARKRALSEVVLGSTDEAQGLTREDLLALLS